MTRLIAIIFFLLMASSAWAVGAPVRIDGGSIITPKDNIIVTTAPTLISSSNANRAALSCTTTSDVYWGDATVGPTKGQLVQANSSIEIHNTAAVYMAADVDTANVSCTEETWPSVTSGSGIFSP